MAEPGRRRRIFIRTVAIAGLSFYGVLFLLVLLWPGLIARGAKALLVNEVNRRIEKVGGLAAAAQGKAASIEEKFNLLRSRQQEEERDAAELSRFIEANAGRIVAGWVEDRAERQAATGKLRVSMISPVAFEIAIEEVATAPVTSGESTTGSRSSRALAALKSRIAGVKTPDEETSETRFHATMLQVFSGIPETMARYQGAVLQRLETAIREKYDDTMRELVREARTFTASNVIIFGLLFLSARTRRSMRVLFPLAAMLLVVTLAFSWIYDFNTNWTLAILLKAYLGWGYLVLVLVITWYLFVRNLTPLMGLAPSDRGPD
jgi:hypothetical protein